jgi:peptide-methionine (S)-S-oxide reductase
VELDYDPTIISYERLLDIFWHSHHPGHAARSPQYKAAIFFHNDRQKALALRSKEEAAARIKSPVYTQILPAGKFSLAEDYHQKYYLRKTPVLLAGLSEIYRTPAELVASTAAARVNGYLAGYGALAELQADIAGLSLPAAARQKLLDLLATSKPRRAGPGCPVPLKPAD